ncbi:MAG: WHG domain-containing protein [Chloroflexota bacterium]
MAKTRHLNREKVVEAAINLAQKEAGVEHLTLAKLAATLDVRTPSLYNHIKSNDDLRQAMALWGLQTLLADMQTACLGQVGRLALMSVFKTYRKFAHQYPAIYPLMLRAPLPDDVEHNAVSNQFVQLMLLLVASCGLAGDEALHVVRGLRSLAHGFISLELAGGFGLDLSLDDSYSQMLHTFLTGLGFPDE